MTTDTQAWPQWSWPNIEKADEAREANKRLRSQSSAPPEIRSTDWLDAAEIRAALLSTLPYYEADDKDDYHYLVKERDIDKAVEAIVAAGRAKASNKKLNDSGPSAGAVTRNEEGER